MRQLKDTVSGKLGEDFEVVESKKSKPKLKIIQIDEEEMKLDDKKLVNTIMKQNNIAGNKAEFYMKVAKRMDNRRTGGTTGNRRGSNEEGSVLLEVSKRNT